MLVTVLKTGRRLSVVGLEIVNGFTTHVAELCMALPASHVVVATLLQITLFTLGARDDILSDCLPSLSQHILNSHLALQQKSCYTLATVLACGLNKSSATT